MPRDFLQGCRDEYDCIVIGSGLAGMTAANTLARGGHSVLLLEQHYKLGGMATWFKRPGGHIFDISLHGFPVGMVKSCRRYWTSEIADSIVQLKNIRFDNPMFSLSTTFNRDDFTRLLIEKFQLSAALTGPSKLLSWSAIAAGASRVARPTAEAATKPAFFSMVTPWFSGLLMDRGAEPGFRSGAPAHRLPTYLEWSMTLPLEQLFTWSET